jgi:NitT/TauT family transport system substrate-binding protein
VDALAMWDTMFATLENMGVRVRHFSHPRLQSLSSGGLYASEAWLRANPDVAARFGRAWAKASTFVFANPEAAIRIHWKQEPRTKPTGIPEDEALRQALHVMRAVMATHSREGKANKAWGVFAPAEWQQYADFLLAEKVLASPVRVEQMITTEFEARFNDFPADKIRELARGYRTK